MVLTMGCLWLCGCFNIITSRQGYNEVNMTDFTQGEQIRTKSKLRRALACTVCILLTVPLRSLVSSSSLDAMIANSNLMLTPDDVICFFFSFHNSI